MLSCSLNVSLLPLNGIIFSFHDHGIFSYFNENIILILEFLCVLLLPALSVSSELILSVYFGLYISWRTSSQLFDS